MHFPPKLELSFADKERLTAESLNPSNGPGSRPVSATIQPNPLAAVGAVAPVAPTSGPKTEEWTGNSSRRLSATKQPPMSRRKLQGFLALAAFVGLTIGCVIAGLGGYYGGIVKGKEMAHTSSDGPAASPAPPAPSQGPVYIYPNTQTFDNLDEVIVTFLGLQDNAMVGAWVGMFRAENTNFTVIPPLPFPATPPWLATAPISYTMIENLQYSQGLFPVLMVNFFEPVMFAVFSGGINNPKLLAQTAPLTPKTSPPLRGRLSRSFDDATEVRLTWHSAYNSGSPRIYFGASSVPPGGNYTFEVPATCGTYTASQMAAEPAKTIGWIDPHYFCFATIAGLTPGSRYYYIYGSTTTGFSQEQSFNAPLAAGPSHNPPAKWLLYGDTGVGSADSMVQHWSEPFAAQTTRHISTAITAAQTAGQPYTGALHIGDLAYATGYAGKWPYFEQMFHADIGSRLPVTMVYGNHERQQVGTGTNAAFTTNDSGGEAGIPMAVRFPITPSYNGNNAQSVAATGYYAIREGPATFIYLNSELAMDPSSAQYQWADSWLSNQFDRTTTPWLFFVWHRPIYISNNIFPAIEAIEPLLLKWMADAVFNGHQHYAMHTAGVYNGTVLNANTSPSIQSDGWIGTQHFVFGNGGQNLYPIPDNEETAPWVEWQGATYGFADLTIADGTSATIRYLSALQDGVVLHSQTLTRTLPRLPVPQQ